MAVARGRVRDDGSGGCGGSGMGSSNNKRDRGAGQPQWLPL